VTERGLIVVGSGPAGVAAAEAFRTHDPDAAVHILTADNSLPYARPPLSKEYLRGTTDDIALHPPDWFTDNGIDVRCGIRVHRIDTAENYVHTSDGTYPYRALLLACGATPAPLSVPGGEHALQLRSLADAHRLRTASSAARSAVVIGAGFIGCEVAASLSAQGISVTLIAPQALPQRQRLGSEAGERLRRLLCECGVRFVGGTAVEKLRDGVVELDNGVSVDTDLIVAATGVRPNTDLAEAAGLRIAQSRVVVDTAMQTSVPGVFVAGDVALAYNATAKRALAVEHWQDATDQGTLAGAAAGGRPGRWAAVPGFWTTIGDSTIKYHAWGDGYDSSRVLDREDGFTVWYEARGVTVGVLACNADDDYDLGERLIAEHRPAPVAVS
jgi:NADPH-dependent 2,4-dienoyl-CoA reductase/sulfur reductase-like enzyme